MKTKILNINLFIILFFTLIFPINQHFVNNNIDSYQVHIFSGDLENIFGDVYDDDDDEFVTTDKNCNVTEYPEQAVKCDLKHMECKDKKYLHHCSCKDGYITYPSNNPKYCNLEQKKQLIAFTLELCVGFGAGHFYRHHYTMGALKLVAFVMGLVFICSFPITAKCISDCDCECLAVLLSIIYYLYLCGLAVWYIWDLVYFGKNKYKDYSYKDDLDEVIPLKPW